ncbi:MAG: formyltransferase family protein [Pseudohongiellaceae bacterium]
MFIKTEENQNACSKMTAVVISDCEPLDLAFIAQLRRAIPNITIIRTFYPAPDEGTKTPRESFFARLARWRSRRLSSPESRGVLKKIPPISLAADVLNSEQGEALIKNLSPDILIACRTTVLKESVFGSVPLALNIHFGLAPRYRGNNTLFWALYRGDTEGVAVTVHQLSRGIDQGNIYGIAHPRIRPWDSEVALANQLSSSAVRIVAKLAKELRERKCLPSGRPQKEKGRLYRGKERTVARELEYLLYRRWLFWSRRYQKESIVLYF